MRDGLGTSLARPAGNLTAVNFFAADLAAKRLGLLRELVPGAARIAVLVNPAHASITEFTLPRPSRLLAKAGLQIHVLNASSRAEIAAAFATIRARAARCPSCLVAVHFSPTGVFNWFS